ncbi:hypothetical protein RR48_04647 [Papilio machaon]|uniref:Uncharacterized protein n=1 Tax=Papilio machaon TaxID=76193 RepID=A0A0N1IC71_PAPMA|nr:hypothetical protein RR48_04647 [Papilio machaon]
MTSTPKSEKCGQGYELPGVVQYSQAGLIQVRSAEMFGTFTVGVLRRAASAVPPRLYRGPHRSHGRRGCRPIDTLSCQSYAWPRTSSLLR